MLVFDLPTKVDITMKAAKENDAVTAEQYVPLTSKN